MDDRWKFDKRLRKRNLRSGDVKKDEYDTFLGKLDDVADNAAALDTKLYEEPEAEETTEAPAEA